MTATQSTTQTTATTAISNTEIMYFGIKQDRFDAIVDVVQYSKDEFLIFFVNFTHEDEIRCEYVNINYPNIIEDEGRLFKKDKGRWVKRSRSCGIVPAGRRKNSNAYKEFFAVVDGKLEELKQASGK